MSGLLKPPPVSGLARMVSGRQQATPGIVGESMRTGHFSASAGLQIKTPVSVPAVQAEPSPPSVNNRSPTADDAHVGSRIKRLRRDLGLTQKQIAKIVGVTGAQFHRYETGSTRVAASRLIAIATALHVRPEVLMGTAASRPEADVPTRSQIGADADSLVELVEVYQTIVDPRRRHALLAFAHAVARGQHSQIAEE